MSSGDRTARALVWSWIQAAAGSIIQLVVTVTLARLLDPESFGIVALSTVLLRFLTYFSQMGLSAAIVQRTALSARASSELLSLAVGLGIVFFFLAYLLAPLALLASDDDQVVAVIRAMALSFLLAGISAIPLGLLRRNLQFREIAHIELVAHALGSGGTAVALAIAGFGVWSIVLGALVQQAIVALSTWGAVSRRTTLNFRMPTVESLESVRYGAGHSLNTFLEFLYFNVETLAISAWYGSRQLGYFNRAFSLSHLPVESVIGSMTRVMFPHLAQLRGDPIAVRSAFLSVFIVAGIYASAFGGALFVCAPIVTTVLLGEHWKGAIPLVQLLAIAVPIRYLLSLESAYLDALGKLSVRRRIVGVCLMAKLLLVLIGGHVELTWFLVLMIVADIAWQLSYVVTIGYRTSVGHRDMVSALVLFLGNGVVIGGVLYGVTQIALSAQLNYVIVFTSQITISLAITGLVMATVVRSGFLGLWASAYCHIPVVRRVAAYQIKSLRD